MKYDRDIFWARVLARFLAAGNLVAAVVNSLAHNWSVAIACVIWVCSALLVASSAAATQATRDRGRLIEAALHGITRETEQD